jgi:hypothetical protein
VKRRVFTAGSSCAHETAAMFAAFPQKCVDHVVGIACGCGVANAKGVWSVGTQSLEPLFVLIVGG